MKLMEQVRRKMIEMEYADDTRRLYARWIVRYILYHGKRHPADLGLAGVEAFVTHLACEQRLAASGCNQALSALIFLYREILARPDVAGAAGRLRARSGRHLPEIASRESVRRVIERLEPKYRLMAGLVYGSGLAVGECVRLRWDEIDLERLEVRTAGRVTMLPQATVGPVREQISRARDWPGNVGRYLFPSSRLHGGRCWFVSDSSLQKAMQAACKAAGVDSHRITPRVLRHSFIMHLLEDGYDPRTVQAVAGLSSVKQVLIYQDRLKLRQVRSPIDDLENIRKKT